LLRSASRDTAACRQKPTIPAMDAVRETGSILTAHLMDG
jgi:hypothetical protein